MKKKINLYLLLVFTTLSTCVDIHAAFAAAADDDYNFSWLDPDKKIYVLQNRKFRKAHAADIYIMGGMGLGETYRKAYQYQPRLGYWFNEDFGIEGFYTGRFNSNNNAYTALAQEIAVGGGSTPLIREVSSQMGVLLNWAPWYAKINVFNTILYFDWYFSLGLGSMGTDIGPKTKADNPSLWKSENLFAVYLGTGHIFHLSEKFMARLDFLGHFYSAKIYGGLAGAPADSSIFSNFDMNLGIGLKL
jgi:outer membrane beta-barrel protein